MDQESEQHDPHGSEPDDLVLTPGGWRPRSRTARVEPGQHGVVRDGHLLVVETETGKVVADLGPVGRGDEEHGADARGLPEPEDGSGHHDDQPSQAAEHTEARRHGGPMRRAGRQHPSE